jgi:uncharacterized membrane protein
MYEVVKNSIIGWWIGVLVALMLWYRAKPYDRALGMVVLLYGFISLFIYGVYNGANPKEAGIAIAVSIAIVSFIPLLTFLSIKSYSTITGVFLFVLLLILLLAIFYSLDYSAEYDVTKGRIVYSTFDGNNTYMGIGWMIFLAAAAIVGFLLLYYFTYADDSDLLRLILLFISVITLIYMGFNSYMVSKIYFVLIILVALSLLL